MKKNYFLIILVITTGILLFNGCTTKTEKITILTPTFKFTDGTEVFAFIKNERGFLEQNVAFVNALTGNLEVISVMNHNLNNDYDMQLMPLGSNDSIEHPSFPSEPIILELPDTIKEGIYVIEGYGFTDDKKGIDFINFVEKYPNDGAVIPGNFLSPHLLINVKSGGKDFKKLLEMQNTNYFYFGKTSIAG